MDFSEFRVGITQQILLGHPIDSHDVGGHVLPLFALPLPDDSLGKLAEDLDESVDHGDGHVVHVDGRSHSEHDESRLVITHECFQFLREWNLFKILVFK